MANSRRGAVRLSSPGFYSLRYLVWQDFYKRNRKARVGSIHLPAFYHKPRSKREYDRQEPMAADWLKNGTQILLGGDLNGRIGSKRLRHLTPAARWSQPVPSGPSGQTIDYVGASVASNWHPIRTQVHKPKNSDHNAVIVTFEWRD